MSGPEVSASGAGSQPRTAGLAIVIRDAGVAVLVAAGLALAVNALRAAGRIPLVASRPYEVLVPCPEYSGKADPLSPAAARVLRAGDLLVDARSAEEHRRWHPPAAVSIPFDYLEPVPRRRIADLLARRPRRVIVFGDGDNPDSGEQLARQLASRGLKNLYFVVGGAPALGQGSRSAP